MTSCVMLSRARPRKPFRSPARIQYGRALAGPRVGYSLIDDLASQLPRALGQSGAPGKGASIVGDLPKVELDGRSEVAAKPEARAVGLPFQMIVILEHDFDAGVDPLGVGGQEVQEPACNLVIRAAREHAGILASGPGGIDIGRAGDRGCGPPRGIIRLGSALVEAARQALLAAFLVHERRLPALLAEVADLLSRFGGGDGHLGSGLHFTDMLGERARQSVRQREDLRGPEARRLTAADPRELADDLFQPPLSRERRREPQN